MIKTPSLVAAYNFNGNANDESGNGYNCAGTATLVDSKFGQCANFNGSQYLSTQNNVDLSNTNKLTICFWMKCDLINSRMVLIEHGINYNFVGSFLINVEADAFIRIYYSDRLQSPQNIIASKIRLVVDQYYHIAVTIDKSVAPINQCILYVNSALDSITHPSLVSSLANMPTAPLFLGARSANSFPFFGQLDNIKIYNKILSSEDIKRIYEGFSPLNG